MRATQKTDCRAFENVFFFLMEKISLCITSMYGVLTFFHWNSNDGSQLFINKISDRGVC